MVPESLARKHKVVPSLLPIEASRSPAPIRATWAGNKPFGLYRPVGVLAIDRGGVDLLILDIDMPRLNGLDVMEELRAQMRTARVPVIVLTAHHGESQEKALDLGALDNLTKPLQTRSLVARVRAALKRVTS